MLYIKLSMLHATLSVKGVTRAWEGQAKGQLKYHCDRQDVVSFLSSASYNRLSYFRCKIMPFCKPHAKVLGFRLTRKCTLKRFSLRDVMRPD